MNVRQIEQIILNNTYTKSDFLKRLTIIREYLEAKFFTDSQLSFSDFLDKLKVSLYEREALIRFDDSFFGLFTKDNLYQLIKGLTENLKSLPLLTLYTPVMLDDLQLDELGKWFRQNLNPELIMDIRINPLLVSGCAYVWKGKYKDLSQTEVAKQLHAALRQA